MTDLRDSPRYPYTYASDWIRGIAGTDGDHMFGSTKLSRSDASRIRSKIAAVIGMDDEVLACMLADASLRCEGFELEPTHVLASVKILHPDGTEEPANMSLPLSMIEKLKAAVKDDDDSADYNEGWDHDPAELYRYNHD